MQIYMILYVYLHLERSSSIVEKELERVIEMTLDCDNIDENISFIKTLISSYDISEDTHNRMSELISEQEKNR